ncbi:hypothetical protein ACOSP7_011898 [Xanthoceras sorbifolium]
MLTKQVTSSSAASTSSSTASSSSSAAAAFFFRRNIFFFRRSHVLLPPQPRSSSSSTATFQRQPNLVNINFFTDFSLHIINSLSSDCLRGNLFHVIGPLRPDGLVSSGH